MIKIRSEKKSDHKVVEDITRKAFYDPHVPGCGEHYLVHIMCGREDFIPKLDSVLKLNGWAVGNTMHTKARLAGESGAEKEIFTFGPVSATPEHQRGGCGKTLMEHSSEQAMSFGYNAIVIFERSVNYVGSDFKSCKKFNICLKDGSFLATMMVRELVPGTLGGRRWVYHDNPAVATSEEEARLYDDSLERMEKKCLPGREESYIMSYSFIK